MTGFRCVVFSLFSFILISSVPVVSGAAGSKEQKAGKSVKLALKFVPGQSEKYRVITEVLRSVESGSIQKKAKSRRRTGKTGDYIEMVFTQTVKSVNPKGNAVVKITINEVKFRSVEKNKVTLDFDSTKKTKNSADKSNIDKNGVVKNKPGALAKLIGKSYTIELSPKTRVVRILDIQDARSVIDKNKQGTAVSTLLSADSIVLRHEVHPLSSSKTQTVRKGDKWNEKKKFNFGMMGKKSYNKTYTLKQLREQDKKQLALVEMEAGPSAENVRDAVGQPINVFSKLFDCNDKYTGSMSFDADSGRVLEYTENLDIKWVAVDPISAKRLSGAVKKSPTAIIMTAARHHKLQIVGK